MAKEWPSLWTTSGSWGSECYEAKKWPSPWASDGPNHTSSLRLIIIFLRIILFLFGFPFIPLQAQNSLLDYDNNDSDCFYLYTFFCLEEEVFDGLTKKKKSGLSVNGQSLLSLRLGGFIITRPAVLSSLVSSFFLSFCLSIIVFFFFFLSLIVSFNLDCIFVLVSMLGCVRACLRVRVCVSACVSICVRLCVQPFACMYV